MNAQAVLFFAFCAAVVGGCGQKNENVEAGPPIATVTPVDSVARKKADSLYLVAERARKTGDEKNSLQLHQEALDIRLRLNPTSEPTAYSLWKTGQLMLNQFRVADADRNLEKARAVAEALSFPPDTLALMFLNAAATKRELNDFPSSQSLAIRALSLARNQPRPNASLMSRCYRSLASSFYSNKQFHEAIENFQSAIELANPKTDAALLGSLYFNVALCYGALNDSRQKLRLLDVAKNILVQSFGDGHHLLGGIWVNKGEMYLRERQLDSALYCFKENLAIRRRLVGDKNFATAGAKESVGNFFASTGQLDSALAYYQGSLISAVPSFESTNVFENPLLNRSELTGDLIPFLVSKATILERMYWTDTVRTDVLQKSLETFLLADSVSKAIRTNLPHDDPQLAQLENSGVPYEQMLSVVSRLYAIHRSEEYLEHVFAIMESSRAVVLKDALSRAEFYNEVGVSEEIKQRESKVRETRAGLVNLFSKAVSDLQRDSIAELLLQNDHDQQQLQRDVKQVNPSYFQVRFGNDAPPLGDLKELMREKGSAWLEFFWGERQLTVLSVNGSGVLLNQIPVDSNLSAAVRFLQQEVHLTSEESLRVDRLRQYASTAFYLYKVLLQPVVRNLSSDKLIISADGPLALFPFEALISEVPPIDELDYHLPYLVNRYFFSYHFSAMQLLKQHSKVRHGDRLLALGYAGSGKGPIRRNGMSDLPGTREEVMAIRDVMTNDANQFLFERDASESAFKNKIREFDLAHLAIHGVGDTLDAMQSRLVFRSEADSTEDGQLFTHELYGLNLEKLDMAVLSACESGVGKQQAGEGAMSIARGFAYAGCPTMVISLWKVNDKTAPAIMAAFYRNVSEHHAIDVSLGQAKRSYLENANGVNAHPSSWAAFLTVGETKAIETEIKFWQLVMLVGVILTVIGGGWLINRKKPVRL